MAANFSSPAALIRSRLQSINSIVRGGSKVGPRIALALIGVAAVASFAPAQVPEAIPTTATLLAGGANSGGTGASGNVLPASGAVCYAGSPYKATDAFGDGCPGPYATFSADFRGGVLADGSGNVYVIDSSNSLVRKIDAKSGLITVFAGGGTACSGKLDSAGDGCPIANTTFNSPRGGGIDPYGNILIAGYSSGTVNVLCTAVSPLCPNTASHKQVGYMYRVAGCVSAVSSGGTSETGTTPGTDGDGLVAVPFGNLSGDVADWGSGSTGYGTCSASVGSVFQPRGVAADQYGNVYIADSGNGRFRVVAGPATFTLPNGTVLTNPLINVLKLNPTYSALTAAAAYGHIYPILGGWASTNNGGTAIPAAAGTACAGSSGGSTLDTLGDGCPYYENSSANSTTIGIAVDPDGNPIFSDVGNRLVRTMIVAGTKMASAIPKANGNPGLTTNVGYIYPLIGLGGEVSGSNGAVNISFTPTQGSLTFVNTAATKLAIGPSGNIYVSDYGNNQIYMFDINTGYVRNVAVNGTACSTAAPDHDSVGDGCSGTLFGSTTPTSSPFAFSGASAGLGIAFTPQGDLILGDIGNAAIRRITATNLAPVRVGTSLTQQVTIHAPAGSTNVTAALVGPSPDVTVGAVTCASAPNADTTLDCQIPVTFAPLTPGQRTATKLNVTAIGPGTSASFPVIGTATGSAFVADIASPIVTALGTVVSATSLAADGSGNVFTMDTGIGHFIVTPASGVSASLGGTLPSSPYQLAVDGQDNLYATNGTSTITIDTLGSGGTYTSSTIAPLLPAASYTTSPVTFTATPAIYGVAVDRQGNIFFSDRVNEAVFEIPVGGYFESANQVVPVLTGFTTVGELALDGAGNLLIADTGAGRVYRLQANAPLYPTLTIALALAASPVIATTVASSVNPTHLAADTAGNAYIQDATAGTVTEVPLSGATATVYITVHAPRGVAVGSTGVVYEAESTLTAINAIQRNAVAYTFPTAGATIPLTLSNTGNLSSTGYVSNDSAEFPITTGSTNGCATIPSVSNPLQVGTACTVTAKFNPGSNGQFVTSTTTLLPASSTIGSLKLEGQEPVGVTYNTTTTVAGPSSAVYVGAGTEITFTVSESASDSTSQTGENVNVTIDAGSATPYALSGGSVSVPVSGLISGAHTITAVYPGDGTYLSSNGLASFTITRAPTTVTWTPGATTQQYSAAIGTSVLNATANAPGSFIYTATPSGGSAQFIHSASYLPIGTYALGVTFVPTDAVDYGSSTGSVASYTVTQATTTAPVGTTQMLVAADSTGNYTTVQAAVNALPSGGSIYIKPGTYPGFISVVQPNVALRGLGGDPTKVILTHEAGSFGGSSYPYTGEFQATPISPGNGGSNGYQMPGGSSIFTGDEGSATLVVAKGINTALSPSTTIPNGFYAENLSLINGYDTDNSTTTTTYETSANGTCAINQTPAMTYNALFNAQTLCASQALTIWITSDLAVMNNVYNTSLQDTIYAASQGSGSNGYVPSREYWFRGKVSGDVDFIFGDAAAVFDNTSIYTLWHGTTATGTETIHAQNKAIQTGSVNDYLSGYVMNSDVFTSQSTGMTSLYFGRPYGTYSTWVMLNSYIDQVNPIGYTTGLGPALGPTTFVEFNDSTYSDPATGSPDLNGIPYLGTGGNSGSGVTGSRETSSTNPGTPEANNGTPTLLTQAQAQAFFPTNFLSQSVPAAVSTTKNWNPTAALAANVNAFVPSGTSASVVGGSSVTILMRPQTPGLGAVAAGTYTIPTGSYTLTDSYNGGASYTLASGTLDASGEAYYTSSTLPAGTHNLTWTYSGDANFAGSTTGSAYVLTVTGGASVGTTTTLGAAVNPIAYGQSASITATVSPASGSVTPTGNVNLTIDGATTLSATLSSGTASFTVPGLTAGSHILSATYTGATAFGPSSTSPAGNLSLTVNKAALTVTGSCSNRVYGQVNVCSALVTGGYQYSDSAATVFTSTPTGTTTAARNSPAAVGYTATPVYTATGFGSTNYTITPANSSFTISGGAAQRIIFASLPNFAHGASYQLSARATSGLPVSYSVTSGNASVSGSTLTVTGTGLVTVQASQSIDPTGDYAPATPVSRSFTAQ